MTSDLAWQMLRYALLAIGGWFVQKGYLTNDTLTTMISAIGTLFVAAWGIYVKANTKAVPAATAARPDVPTVSPLTGAVKN